MKLKELTVKGFESALDKTTIDFTDKKMVGFVGENGTGKSLLSIWAPMFALYGKVRQPTVKEAIASTAGQATVELDFEVNGSDYHVVRHLPRSGKQEATLYAYNDELEAWEARTEKNVRETNDAIAQVIGMPYSTATATFVSEQDKHGSFSEAVPMERRRILMQLLQLDQYDEYHEQAKEAHKTAQTNVASFEAQREELDNMYEVVRHSESEHADADENDLQEELAELEEIDREVQRQEAEHAFRNENKEQELADAKKALTDFNKQNEEDTERLKSVLSQYDRDSIKRRITQLEHDVSQVQDAKFSLSTSSKKKHELNNELSNAKVEVQDAEDELDSIKQKGTTVASEIKSLNSRVEELQNQRDEMPTDWHDETRCTTCKQHISPEILDRVRSEMNADIESLKNDADKQEQVRGDLKIQYGNIRQTLETAKATQSNLESQLEQVNSDLVKANTVVENEERTKQSLQSAEEELETVDQKISELNEQLQEIAARKVPQEFYTRIEQAQKAMDDSENEETPQFDYSARNKISGIQRELNHREEVRRKEASLDDRVTKLDKALQEATSDEAHYKLLRKAFSPIGIPAMILAGAVTELEDVTNEYLDKFSNGLLSLNIETQKESQKGEVSEKLLITVNAPDGTRSYESFSGGQKFRINLAIRIAMSKIIARRSGANAVETFFIDEGFGSLDEAGILSTVSALEELSEEVTVIAVSHIDSVKDGFHDVFQTSMDTGVTSVSQIRSST